MLFHFKRVPVFLPRPLLIYRSERDATDVRLVVVVGGDGTLLKAAAYVAGDAPTPPILGFRAGKLNRLLPFDFDGRYDAVLRAALEGRAEVEERLRLGSGVGRHDRLPDTRILRPGLASRAKCRETPKTWRRQTT